MELLRARLRITNVDESLDFFCKKLGLIEIGREQAADGRNRLIVLATPQEAERARWNDGPALELLWERKGPMGDAGVERGHVVFQIEDLYWQCHFLLNHGVEMPRPPHDGRMARVQSPDGHTIELVQLGNPREPVEPWTCMEDKDPEAMKWPKAGNVYPLNTR